LPIVWELESEPHHWNTDSQQVPGSLDWPFFMGGFDFRFEISGRWVELYSKLDIEIKDICLILYLLFSDQIFSPNYSVSGN